MSRFIHVDGATVMRQTSYEACQLVRPDGRTWQIPRIYRWLFVMQHREPGRRDTRLRYYEISQN